FPAPSVSGGRDVKAKLARNARRDRGSVCGIVATSLRGAKRRSNPRGDKKARVDCFASLAMMMLFGRFGSLKIEFVARPGRHHPRMRMIQYSRAVVIELRNRSVLDTRMRGV